MGLPNPFRESDDPIGSANEVARARIHEEHETKRELIKEREETRRRAISTDGYYLIRFCLPVGLVLALTLLVWVVGYWIHYTATPPQCAPAASASASASASP